MFSNKNYPPGKLLRKGHLSVKLLLFSVFYIFTLPCRYLVGEQYLITRKKTLFVRSSVFLLNLFRFSLLFEMTCAQFNNFNSIKTDKSEQYLNLFHKHTFYSVKYKKISRRYSINGFILLSFTLSCCISSLQYQYKKW